MISPSLRSDGQPRAAELPRIDALKLSEKGCEQRSDREFGRYTENEMGQKARFGGP